MRAASLYVQSASTTPILEIWVSCTTSAGESACSLLPSIYQHLLSDTMYVLSLMLCSHCEYVDAKAVGGPSSLSRRPLTEEESKACFAKLAKYIGNNLVQCVR